MKNKQLILIFIFGIVFILLILIPIIFYWLNFNSLDLSNNKTTWGEFGDFIGGTINPIIGIFNLILIVAITLYVSKFDSFRQFNEYRYNAYTDLCKYFDETPEKTEALEKLKTKLEIYTFNNQFLFSKNKNINFLSLMDELIESVNGIIKAIDNNSSIPIGEPIYIERTLGIELETAFKDFPKIETPEIIALKSFSLSKKKILKFMQDVMINR